MKLLSGHINGLTTFTGRENREPFWLWILITYAAQTIISVIAAIPMYVFMFRRIGNAITSGNPDALKDQAAMYRDMMPYTHLMALVGVVVGLLFMLLVAAAVVRRLHDGNRSGWWAALVALLQIVSQLSSLALMMSGKLMPVPGKPMAAAMQAFGPFQYVALLAIIILIVVLILPGSVGANRFGEDPLGR